MNTGKILKKTAATNVSRKLFALSWLAGFFAVLSALIGVSTMVLSANQFSDIRANWRAYDQEIELKVEALSAIRKHMGYGAFIHNYKNYILRHDESDFQMAMAHILHTEKEIDTYAKMGVTDEERNALDSLLGTLQQYHNKLQSSQRLLAQGLTTQEVDALVKVDDMPARSAMYNLDNYLDEQHMIHGDRMISAVNRGTALVEVSSYALPLSILSVLFVIWSLLSIARQTGAVSSHLQAVVDNAFDAIVIYNKNGLIQSVNPKTEKMFGYRGEDLISKPIGFILPEADGGMCEFFLEGKAIQGIEDIRECVGINRADQEFPVEMAVTRLELADGGRMVAFLRDITKRKESEVSLKALRGRLEMIVNSTPAVIYTAPPDNIGQPSFVSENVFNLFGYLSTETIERKNFWKEWVHPEDVPALFMANRKLKTTGTRVIEYRIQLPDRTWRWVHDEAVLVVHGNGEAEVVGSILDVTEKKQAEEARLAAQNALHNSQKMEALGQLSSGMAHEFNNMLVPLICLTELTMDDLPEGSQGRDNLATSLDAALKARGLIQQILVYSRPEGRVFNDIRIKDTVIQAIKMLRASLSTNVDICDDITISDTLLLRCDPTEISQVVMNLGRNAAHAMGRNGGRLKIRLSEEFLAEQDVLELDEVPPGHCLVLQIEDNGCGMNKETQAKAFNPFFTTKEVGEGTGMGLSVVHGIVKDCGGDIRVSSVLEQGTSFQIYLPLTEKEPLKSASVFAEGRS